MIFSYLGILDTYMFDLVPISMFGMQTCLKTSQIKLDSDRLISQTLSGRLPTPITTASHSHQVSRTIHATLHQYMYMYMYILFY